MRAYVGVTDTEWRRFLADRPHLDEVNFWRPSGRGFAALAVGEPFFFKARHPMNYIVGGGLFSGFERMTTSEAWDLFGEANGVASLEELRRRIAHYRTTVPVLLRVRQSLRDVSRVLDPLVVT